MSDREMLNYIRSYNSGIMDSPREGSSASRISFLKIIKSCPSQGEQAKSREINVEGTLHEKGTPYFVEWSFDWDLQFSLKLQQDIEEIRRALDREPNLNRSDKEEVYSVINEWLKVGCVDGFGVDRFSYLEFQKNGEILRYMGDDFFALQNFASAIASFS